MDPWYDHLVLPGALIVLIVQAVALGVPQRRARVALASGGLALMGLIFAAITTLPGEEYGPNIGAGIVLLLIPISVLILVAAVMLRSRS